jgi:hypothetical protein
MRSGSGLYNCKLRPSAFLRSSGNAQVNPDAEGRNGAIRTGCSFSVEKVVRSTSCRLRISEAFSRATLSCPLRRMAKGYGAAGLRSAGPETTIAPSKGKCTWTGCSFNKFPDFQSGRVPFLRIAPSRAIFPEIVYTFIEITHIAHPQFLRIQMQADMRVQLVRDGPSFRICTWPSLCYATS